MINIAEKILNGNNAFLDDGHFYKEFEDENGIPHYIRQYSEDPIEINSKDDFYPPCTAPIILYIGQNKHKEILNTLLTHYKQEDRTFIPDYIKLDTDYLCSLPKDTYIIGNTHWGLMTWNKFGICYWFNCYWSRSYNLCW